MGLLVITFSLALGLSFVVLMVALRPAKSNRNVRERLITIQQPLRSARADTKTAQLEKAEKRDYAARLGTYLQRYEFSKKLQTLLVHANSTMSVGRLMVASAATAAGCALLSFVFLHGFLPAAVALAAGATVPYSVLKFKRGRRLAAFNAALAPAIDLMARALRAGHSINSLMELVAEQSPEPLGGEFGQVFQQQKFGLRFRDALLALGERVPSRDLHFLITAILVQRETGGDLTEIFDQISRVIRERLRIEGEVRTHTAQGRLTGWILGLLPVVLLVLINIVSPGYSSLLFHDPTGQKLLYAGGILIIVGGLVIRQIVDIQV
jgi:tight adherence protein B